MYLYDYEIKARIQTVYREQVAEPERNCDWWVTMDEPWRSIAAALGVR